MNDCGVELIAKKESAVDSNIVMIELAIPVIKMQTIDSPLGWRDSFQGGIGLYERRHADTHWDL
ncbi:MAG: hypothetical protein D6704_00575 [Nitrospirae bacterium]|nr:MAG: hypothetical protein D6704_00575 [Nitrospirota bacterium]